MTIIEALGQADTDHIVFFLLTAYAESLCWYGSAKSSVPARVLRLPVAGIKDVLERVNALRRARRLYAHRPSRARLFLEEATDVFDTASRRLRFLARRAKARGPG
jgi:hypothetical protein